MAEEEKKSRTWIVWLLIGLCLVAIPIGILSRKSQSSGESSDASVDSSWSMKFRDRILVVYLEGVISDMKESSLLESGGVPKALKKLTKAAKDDRIKGVLIRINSPGGTVGASQELNDAVAALKKKKPVVASMGDIAASGGYYVACATDKIYANPGTLTGSIGVIMSLLNFKDLADKVGIHPNTVKSGTFKDIASPYRAMTPEERDILQGLIDDSYKQFVAAVASGRGMKEDQVRKLADGRVYSGRQAKELGLVDELGGYYKALAYLQETCKKKDNLKKDLPVDDSSSEGLLSVLLESASFLEPAKSRAIESSVAERLLPASLNSRYYKQPLWLMQ